MIRTTKTNRNSTLSILFVFLFLSFTESHSNAQEPQTENVILITLDGLRWQELFGGVDKSILEHQEYTKAPEQMRSRFWSEDQVTRRQKLMPFFSNTISNEGLLYGNRWEGSNVDCINELWFSYPGYNEILTGIADDLRITSNAKTNNPNLTILEFINNQNGFKGKVAAFGSWDVFPFIINEERSGVPVNAGFEKAKDGPLSDREEFLNQLQDEIPSPWGTVRLDAFTHHFAMEYFKKNSPRLLYVAYGETDDFAHDGDYDHYIRSAHQTDQFIKEWWDYLQSQPQYAGKTTMIITTDHGRGTDPISSWTGHGSSVKDAGQIWIAAIGPNIKQASAYVKGQFYQNQIARTIAELLGFQVTESKIGNVLPRILGN